MGRSIQDLLSKPVFKPLDLGIHRVRILDYKVVSDKDDNDYMRITFAPADNLKNEHRTPIFPASEEGKFCQLTMFFKNLQRFTDEDGMPAIDALKYVIDKKIVIPATYERNDTDDGETYFNWTLGYAKPAKVTPPDDDEDDDDIPERDVRA